MLAFDPLGIALSNFLLKGDLKMSVSSLCKIFLTTFSRNLQLTSTKEERYALATDTLDHIGKKLFTELDRLFEQKGITSEDYRLSQEAVLDLLTFVAVSFVRNCSNFRQGISSLEELADKSGNPEVKKKLVIYANQLKRRWKESEPSAVMHNPREKHYHRQTKASSNLGNALRIGLLLVATLCFLFHLDLTSLIFPHWNEVGQPQNPTQDQATEQKEIMPTSRQLSAQPYAETVARQPEQDNDGYYTYSDEQGVIHMVNDLEKVPLKYRSRMKGVIQSEPNGKVTPVVIDGNKVFVPVTLTFHGRSVNTHLLLDTGSSITAINSRLASSLGIEDSDVQIGRTSVADGRSLRTYIFLADSITVGARTLYSVRTNILPGTGGFQYDGLLGMDFLRNFRYHVNFDRSVIEWGA